MFCALCTARVLTSSTILLELILPKLLIIVELLLAYSRLIVFSAVISVLEIFFITITI